MVFTSEMGLSLRQVMGLFPSQKLPYWAIKLTLSSASFFSAKNVQFV